MDCTKLTRMLDSGANTQFLALRLLKDHVSRNELTIGTLRSYKEILEFYQENLELSSIPLTKVKNRCDVILKYIESDLKKRNKGE